jgi:hypothetical protein
MEGFAFADVAKKPGQCTPEGQEQMEMEVIDQTTGEVIKL